MSLQTLIFLEYAMFPPNPPNPPNQPAAAAAPTPSPTPAAAAAAPSAGVAAKEKQEKQKNAPVASKQTTKSMVTPNIIAEGLERTLAIMQVTKGDEPRQNYLNAVER